MEINRKEVTFEGCWKILSYFAMDEEIAVFKIGILSETLSHILEMKNLVVDSFAVRLHC